MAYQKELNEWFWKARQLEKAIRSGKNPSDIEVYLDQFSDYTTKVFSGTPFMQMVQDRVFELKRLWEGIQKDKLYKTTTPGEDTMEAHTFNNDKNISIAFSKKDDVSNDLRNIVGMIANFFGKDNFKAASISINEDYALIRLKHSQEDTKQTEQSATNSGAGTSMTQDAGVGISNQTPPNKQMEQPQDQQEEKENEYAYGEEPEEVEEKEKEEGKEEEEEEKEKPDPVEDPAAYYEETSKDLPEELKKHIEANDADINKLPPDQQEMVRAQADQILQEMSKDIQSIQASNTQNMTKLNMPDKMKNEVVSAVQEDSLLSSLMDSIGGLFGGENVSIETVLQLLMKHFGTKIDLPFIGK